MGRRLNFLACMLLTAAMLWNLQTANAQPDNSWLNRFRTAFSVRVAEPPIIDGDLSDPCWKDADVQTHFFVHNSTVQARGKTYFMCVHDGNTIFFGWKCEVTNVHQLRSEQRQRDGRVWEDDSIEIFLLPSADDKGDVRYQFIVNTLGNIYDARSDRGVALWNANLKVAVKVVATHDHTGYWSGELAIAFADLEVSPKEGAVWRVNFCRTWAELGELSTWMPILEGGFDQPNRYGRLVIRRPTGEDLAEKASYERLLTGQGAPVAARTAIAVGDAPVLIKKVPVSDCRILRAFAGEPVDGTVRSLGHSVNIVLEYPTKGVGAGIFYHYNHNDGLHITLADSDGFDAVVLRGYAQTRMYADSTNIARPDGGKLLWEFVGGREMEVAILPKRAATRRVSFFETRAGNIGDVSFYRVEKPIALGKPEPWAPEASSVELPAPSSKYDVGNLSIGLEERYPPDARRCVALKPAVARSEPLSLEAGRPVHFISVPFAEERGLAAVGFEVKFAGADPGSEATFVVQDPLNPRRDLVCLRLVVPESGVLRPVLDFPDQIILKNCRLWFTLACNKAVRLSSPDGGGPVFRLYFVPRDKALPEALAHRKFLMRTLFGPLTEARPWSNLHKNMPREEFFAKVSYGDRCPELFMTIDQCIELDPTDDLVRQYREWIFHRQYDIISPVPLPPEPPHGPAWAWYGRLAWLEMKRMTGWWLEERMVPTGEVGVGGIQDDGDFYQQLADLPYFETGGLASKVLDGAARIAELAERDHLTSGINRRTTDSLHAYEEGINHLALMARWYYGDPVYLERCMESARNMEKLTIVTPDGRRHFRSHARMGYDHTLTPFEPDVDGDSAFLMWHTALQTADYNRNPLALKLVREYADTWLRFMNPPNWPTQIEVKTGRVVHSYKDRPLLGGYSSQAVTFVWLYALTSDRRYIEPFLYYYRKGEAPPPANRFLGDVIALGGLDDLDGPTMQKLADASPQAALFIRQDPMPLQAAIIGNPKTIQARVDNLCDARRFPDMYTTAQQYADRVLLGDLQCYAAMSYLGGFTKRNKYNPTQAISWEGYGDEFGALVVRNRRDGLKVMAYNYSTTTRTGAVRVWALDHGEYRVSVGHDLNGDGVPDRKISETKRELARADRIHLSLPPQVVTVLEIVQTRQLDPIYFRSDLAIAARELEITQDTISGVVHNIGSATANECEVALLDARGRKLARLSLGELEAPLDLVPRRKEFRLNLPPGPRNGWRLVVDPDDVVPEIYEGNNEVRLDELPANDYRRGWE